MSVDPRHAIESLQIGEMRTSGVRSELESDDIQRLGIERIEVRDLKLPTPLGLVSATNAAFSDVAVRLRRAPEAGGPLDRLAGVTVGELRIEGVSVGLEVMPLPAAGGPPKAWRLDALAALDGTLHADMTDAAWVFDAKATIPISRGRIDFNRATVEHIGPDSSMGLSRMGIFVDAPNGRTYLYLLSATHVPGATFERRGGGLLSSWTGDRGSIDLQPFFECFLSGMPMGALATGAGDMIARTRINAELRLGDGVMGNDQDRVVFTGHEQGKNRIELSSASSGPGILLRMPELRAAESHCEQFGTVISTGAMSAMLSVHLKNFAAALPASVSITELTLRDIACSDGVDARSTEQLKARAAEAPA
jgi:hypothetical protein